MASKLPLSGRVHRCVQQGKDTYAAMLADRTGIEDEPKHQLSSKQQAAIVR